MADERDTDRPGVKGGEHAHGGLGSDTGRGSSSGREGEPSRAMGEIGQMGGEESVRMGMSGESAGRISPGALQESLKGIDCPAKRQEMARTAERHGASRQVVDRINQLPDREYRSAADVSEAFGRIE